MCDFAADAAAAEQLLVGRVLTVKGCASSTRKTSLVMRISRVSPSGRRSQLAVSEGKCERSFD